MITAFARVFVCSEAVNVSLPPSLRRVPARCAPVASRLRPDGTGAAASTAQVSDAECLDQHLRDLPGRVLLLPGDEAAVADGECLEQPALHVVGAAAPEFVLDPEQIGRAHV